jgi:hypothetical protein
VLKLLRPHSTTPAVAGSAAVAAAATTKPTPTAVVDFGVHEDRNKTKRRKMEDASAADRCVQRRADDGVFRRVYDGHSGADAAKFCASNLHLVCAIAILNV